MSPALGNNLSSETRHHVVSGTHFNATLAATYPAHDAAAYVQPTGWCFSAQHVGWLGDNFSAHQSPEVGCSSYKTSYNLRTLHIGNCYTRYRWYLTGTAARKAFREAFISVNACCTWTSAAEYPAVASGRGSTRSHCQHNEHATMPDSQASCWYAIFLAAARLANSASCCSTVQQDSTPGQGVPP